ncbi:hypothetical protein [Cryobacterium zongtaii]|uniref:hypothetical protein n=1 Tax=Cryobacterium zongtaii TaxID=1259217 RepID=UPI0010574F92|nr:hypothetical protein [Cryobacterium zongtaii]
MRPKQFECFAWNSPEAPILMGSVGSASLQLNVLEELEGSAPTLCQKGTLTGTACPAWRGAEMNGRAAVLVTADASIRRAILLDDCFRLHGDETQRGVDGSHPHVMVVTASPDFVDVVVLTGLGQARQFDRGAQAVSAVLGDDKGSLDLSWTGVIGCSEQTGPRRHGRRWEPRRPQGAASGSPAQLNDLNSVTRNEPDTPLRNHVRKPLKCGVDPIGFTFLMPVIGEFLILSPTDVAH